VNVAVVAAALAALTLGAGLPASAAGRHGGESAPRAGQSVRSGGRAVVLKWARNPSRTNVLVEAAGVAPEGLKLLKESPPSSFFESVLSVYVLRPGLKSIEGLPAMLGSYKVTATGLQFESAYPAEPGMSYRAVFRPGAWPGRAASRPEVVSDYSNPARVVKPTTVVRAIYPTDAILPENLLKFYVHFSAPMSRGNIYDHIRLRDGSGKDVELPFLEIDEELWDPTMTRLTLFIDPGRIKRGVKPLEDIGPALEEGKQFTLVIDKSWKDGTGTPLKATHQKSFRVGPSDREPPDPDRWRIAAPRAGTREALAIIFPEPMDHALAHRFLRVTTESGREVNGVTQLGAGERKWTFTPRSPWSRGSHRLVVRTAIEDLAGNNIGKPFEVDLFDTIERHIKSATVTLPFEVK
jgi:hypothetical protein